MTVEIAKKIVAAVKKASCSGTQGTSCSGAFAVTDDASVLVYLETIDGVLAGGPDLAIRKAKASALWRRPTQLFQDAVNKGTNTSYAGGPNSKHGLRPLQHAYQSLQRVRIKIAPHFDPAPAH